MPFQFRFHFPFTFAAALALFAFAAFSACGGGGGGGRSAPQNPPAPTCTSAQRLIGGACMNCAAPNRWNDNNNPPTCEAPPPPTCTSAQRLIGGTCMNCAAPSTWNDGVSPPRCEAPPQPNCTSAQRLIGGTCMNCAAPNMWNDGNSPPTCEAPSPPPPPPTVGPSTGIRGQGVNIGVVDSGVDVGHRDFQNSAGTGSRISSTGANFLYRQDGPETDPGSYMRLNDNFSVFVEAGNEPLFQAFPSLSQAGRCTSNSATLQDCARAMIESISEIQTRFSLTDPQLADMFFAFREGANNYYRLPMLPQLEHGTIVASLAAGNNLGEANRATIIPVSIEPPPNNQPPPLIAADILSAIDNGREHRLTAFESVGEFHLVNLSVGSLPRDETAIRNIFDAVKAGSSGSRRRTFYEAMVQLGVAESDKAVLVWAAGNESRLDPTAEPELPRFYPELRDHWVAVAATGPIGSIASYSDRCGPLPQDWNSNLHGRHYCLAALGEGNGAAFPNGRTVINDPTQVGTSYAAPRVTGAIAAVMRNARGSVSAVEALRRIKRTANNTGIYSDSDVYGAGLLDLQAALATFGNAQMGTATGLQAPVTGSALALPGAHGAAVARGLQGVEIAAFDALNYPFWYAAADFVHTQIQPTLPLWARMDSAPNEQNDLLQHLQWNEAHNQNAANTWRPRMTLDRDTLGFSLAPFSDAGMANKTLLRGLRFGMLFEGKTHQGARPAGAFGADVSSQMLFVSGEQNFELGGGEKSPWSLQTRLLLGAGKPDYQRGAMFRAGASLYSSGALALQHRRGDVLTQLGVAQPLRAESGRGVLHYAGGRALSGARLYETREFSLAPKPRALRVTLRHERPVNLARWFGPFGEGLFALELLHAHNRGHIRGAQETRLDAAWQLRW